MFILIHPFKKPITHSEYSPQFKSQNRRQKQDLRFDTSYLDNTDSTSYILYIKYIPGVLKKFITMYLLFNKDEHVF